MSRHVNLGYNHDMAVGGILNNVASLLLRIKTAMRLSIKRSGIVINHRFGAKSGYFGEARILFYFDTPTLIVGKMPMKTVDVMQGKNVDKILYLVRIKEMTGYIKHGTAISKTRIIGDYCSRKNYLLSPDGGNRLSKGLDAIECTGCSGTAYLDFIFVDTQTISFFIIVLQTGGKNNHIFSRPVGCSDEAHAGHIKQVIG